jgi:shikimate dehydrogenase
MPAAYGLIGYPLTHSFSPAYFKQKFERENIDASYTAFPLPSIDSFPALLREHPGLKGLNVTIPYKEAIIPYLSELSDEAHTVGAVNCIKIEGERTTGYNTDIIGF